MDGTDGLPLFDAAAGQAAKAAGQAEVSANNPDWLGQARLKALYILQRQGWVSSDCIQKELPRPPEVHPNTVGAIFKKLNLVPIGTFQTERTSGHGRLIRKWGSRKET